MAIMIPSVMSPEVKSTAEKRIFEWFKNAKGTDDWIVLHSLGIATHNKVLYGETDFLVLAPKYGFFALEVKGGRVRRENGIWYFTNRYGQTNSKVRGPFEQAKDGIFSIMSSLKAKIDSNHLHIANTLFGFGVMFPDIKYSISGIDEEQWQVFDSRNGDNVKGFIKRLSSESINKWNSHYGINAESKLPTVEDVKYVASLLRSDFDYVVSMSTQLKNANEELIKLTTEQYRYLDQLEDNARCLIQGAAGTGKTLLAVEEAKRSVANGEKVALFCFNSNLASWLEYHFLSVPSELRPEFVGTIHKFMIKTTADFGNKPAYPRNESDIQDYYKVILPKATSLALKEMEIRFDKIIIDEAQDLLSDDYLEVLDTCLRKGIDRGRWTMFGDFSMQAIYTDGVSGNDLIENLEVLSSFSRFRLTVNCRNTKPICREIENVTGVKVNKLWTKVEGPAVDYQVWSSKEVEETKLNTLLDKLFENGIKPKDITILSPMKKEDSIVKCVSKYRLYDFSVPHKGITFSTIQAYKGIENTVIILTDIDNLSEEKLMYVGLSRAKSGLFVLLSSNAKKQYDKILMGRLLK